MAGLASGLMSGMDDEYPVWSGYGPVSSGWKAGFGVVVAVSWHSYQAHRWLTPFAKAFALLYILGLVIGLPRQLRRERESREIANPSAYGFDTLSHTKSGPEAVELK